MDLKESKILKERHWKAPLAQSWKNSPRPKVRDLGTAGWLRLKIIFCLGGITVCWELQKKIRMSLRLPLARGWLLGRPGEEGGKGNNHTGEGKTPPGLDADTTFPSSADG